MKGKKLLSFVLMSIAGLTASAADQFVLFEQSAGAKLLLTQQKDTIVYDAKDWKGVHIAVRNLRQDLEKVTGSPCAPVVVGTIGKSAEIDQLVKQKKIDGKALKGKREKYLLQVIDGKLVIAGSDKRGTIYGIYELSKQIGVSPWYYWADVPAEKHDRIYIKEGVYTDGEPAVRYRGIFLNDEAPALSGWNNQFFGKVFGHVFYEHVFELLLRLKGNYLWPAMWGNAFYADDPLNYNDITFTIDGFNYSFHPGKPARGKQGARMYWEQSEDALTAQDKDLVYALSHCHWARISLKGADGMNHVKMLTDKQLEAFAHTFELYRAMGGKF